MKRCIPLEPAALQWMHQQSGFGEKIRSYE